MSQVRAGPRTPTGARLRLRAVGTAYLEFAGSEPGLFDVAFAATDHPVHGTPDEQWPFDRLRAALDDMVQAGLLDATRRPDVDYPTWASVHGLAVLLRGPLRSLPEGEKTRLKTQVLEFISTAITQ
jgi:WHG domain-containing protein